MLLQIAAPLVIALYVLYRTFREPEPGRFLARLAFVSAASWIAEESCILLYGFYRYSPTSALFLGHVPVLIILIWPIVIHSASDLASQLRHPNDRLVPIVTAAMVCTDASLIEPVAVNAGLWSWTQPGIFCVPPIGILGWGYFALSCMLVLGRDGWRSPFRWRDLLVLVLPVIGAHVLLLSTWWGVLRWVNHALNSQVVLAIAWGVSLFLVYRILRHQTGTRVERKSLLLRLPAALLFFALLAANATRSEILVLYALAFVPPYFTLMAQQYKWGQTLTIDSFRRLG